MKMEIQTQIAKLESDLPRSSVGNERQVRRAAENTGSSTVEEAEHTEDENRVVGPNHDPKPQPGPTRSEDPVEEQRQDEEDIKRDGLHRVEPDESREARVSDDAEVESEEGDEGGVREGAVEGEEGDEGVEEDGEVGVLGEEVAAVLEGVEEGESVGGDGDQAFYCGRGGGGGVGHADCEEVVAAAVGWRVER